MLSTPFSTSNSTSKRKDDVKRRLQSVLSFSPYAVYYGFVPFVIYLGFKLGADPGTPPFTILSILPIG